jgi:D-alanyl-lipoteichoic acid acyltransferase DltB (MBOAT superfamily)
MLGFRFNENFTLPYFSKSITEFWGRWHISLSSWLKDYLYIPLGGNRKGKWKTYRNILFTMLLGGLWHGASWNFIIWGALNGLYLCIEKITNSSKFNSNNFLLKCVRSLYVFILISFSWIFFRSATFEQAAGIINKICFHFNVTAFYFWDLNIFPSIIFELLMLCSFEYFVLRKKTFDQLFELPKGHWQLAGYTCMFIFLIILFGNSNGSQFIYFQF